MNILKFFSILYTYTCILWACGFVPAQTNVYHPFPDSNAVWISHCGQGYLGEHQWDEKYYITTEDTLIGGEKYNKVFSSNQYSSNQYYGAYRNDIINRKILWAVSDTQDVIIYDFSLAIGDSFIIPKQIRKTQCLDTLIIVRGVDSILISGAYRKIYNNFIIEGIGSYSGLFEYHLSCFEYGCRLKCFQQNDSVVYGGNCTVGIEDIRKDTDRFVIYPNPSNGRFFIETQEKGLRSKISIFIYDLRGKQLYNSGALNYGNNKIMIDASFLSKGIYFIEVNSDNNRSEYAKLIKQ